MDIFNKIFDLGKCLLGNHHFVGDGKPLTWTADGQWVLFYSNGICSHCKKKTDKPFFKKPFRK